jgi:hypothetical protein
VVTKFVQLRGDGWRSYLKVRKGGICDPFGDATFLMIVFDVVLVAAGRDIKCACLFGFEVIGRSSEP